jgi:hypothetical protein
MPASYWWTQGMCPWDRGTWPLGKHFLTPAGYGDKESLGQTWHQAWWVGRQERWTEWEGEECYGCMAATGKSSPGWGLVRQPPELVLLAAEMAQWPFCPAMWVIGLGAHPALVPFSDLLGCMAPDSSIELLLGTTVAATTEEEDSLQTGS